MGTEEGWGGGAKPPEQGSAVPMSAKEGTLPRKNSAFYYSSVPVSSPRHYVVSEGLLSVDPYDVRVILIGKI